MTNSNSQIKYCLILEKNLTLYFFEHGELPEISILRGYALCVHITYLAISSKKQLCKYVCLGLHIYLTKLSLKIFWF